MPHQCVRCSRIIPPGSRELLEGCADCGGRFFFYIKEDQIEKIKEKMISIPAEEKKKIEKDIRDMAGIIDEDAPVILDIESVRAVGEGKFEIDLIKLFRRDQPLVYKLEEGKYIIDMASTLKTSAKELKEIRNPDEKKK
jgi:predicted  nucleic acid-binding Zn-ribbon protein